MISTIARLAVPTQRLAFSRAFASKASLPNLPYEYNALEPSISGQIMEIHHKKHHQTYINNYNTVLEQIEPAQKAGDAAKLISLQKALKFNGGGHVNHSLFWENLAPSNNGGGGSPSGALASAIDEEFGSLDKFK